MRFLLPFFGTLALLGLTAAGPAVSQPSHPILSGSFSLQSPVYNDRTGAVATSRSTELLGHLEIQNLVPRSPLTVVLNANTALGGWRSRYDFDNTLQAGIEVPVRRDVTFYSYWDRQPALGSDRVWAGLRWSFGGR